VKLSDCNIPSPDLTFPEVGRIHSGHMKRAALYARVSTDKQSLSRQEVKDLRRNC
jgi:predicted site-specific integrase-resolvase